MPARFATLLRPGTGALRQSGENCRCQNQFGMDDDVKLFFYFDRDYRKKSWRCLSLARFAEYNGTS